MTKRETANRRKLSLSIRDQLKSVLGGQLQMPSWPPDVFAAVATILAETGGYVYATRLGSRRESWPRDCSRIAKNWLVDGSIPVPAMDLWNRVIKKGSTCMSEVSDNPELCLELIQLLGLADEACAGVGIDSSDDGLRAAIRTLLLNKGRSLTRSVNTDRARVLPKQHTPQNGLTLRSLSHHLSLIRPRGVVANWSQPLDFPAEVDRDIINILVCPWPKTVSELDFKLMDRVPDHLVDSEDPHRFFAFQPDSDTDTSLENFKRDLTDRIKSGRERCGDIHLIVFPELSLSDAQLEVARKIAYERSCMLVAGVRHKGRQQQVGVRNTCFVDPGGLLARSAPSDLRDELTSSSFRFMGSFQDKHHRWSLDWQQIRQYGLGGRLPSSKQCWEWTPINQRRIRFWTIGSWLTWAPLICEDLARQDPVSDILRGVAPNLVVALLMDGPQLATRWSARFASVLAEDPGSSVLTVTCLGMAERSRAPDGSIGCRTVALWRDRLSGIHELSLGAGSDSLVISVSPIRKREWSADGREDGGVSSTPVFAGFTQLGPSK